MPILIATGIGGTVEWYAPVRPDAAPTVGIVNSSGGAIVAPLTAATLDAVATALAVGAPAESRVLTVTAGAGILPNRRYVISGGVLGQDEAIEVETVSGTTVVSKYPLYYSHAAASAFVGTRISYAIPAAVALIPLTYCRASFAWKVGTVAQPEGVVDFIMTRHPLYCPISIVDLLAERPLLPRTLAAQTDLTQVILRAYDEVLELLWSRGVLPQSVSGTNKLRRPVTYQALLLCAEQYGVAQAAERDYYAKRVADSLEVFIRAGAIDDDDDNAIELSERHQRGGDQYGA